jgi:hypothetical protein
MGTLSGSSAFTFKSTSKRLWSRATIVAEGFDLHDRRRDDLDRRFKGGFFLRGDVFLSREWRA